MEKIKVFYKSDVEFFINELIYILYKEDYFIYLENAIEYKDKLIDFIEQNIATFPSKSTPLFLNHLGSKYIFYKSNSRTTWYIFFENQEKQYLVTYISNNHAEIAKFLNP
jgi:hypothetical protein